MLGLHTRGTEDETRTRPLVAQEFTNEGTCRAVPPFYLHESLSGVN